MLALGESVGKFGCGGPVGDTWGTLFITCTVGTFVLLHPFKAKGTCVGTCAELYSFFSLFVAILDRKSFSLVLKDHYGQVPKSMDRLV